VINASKGVHYIMDKHSRDGTYVNGKKIPPKTRHSLKHGDLVAFGKLLLDESNCYTYVYQRVPSLNSNVRAEVTCTVCMGFFIDPYSVTPCGHTFCRDCIGGWLQATDNKTDCPLCREEICCPFAIPCRMANTVLKDYSPADFFECNRKRRKNTTLEEYITPTAMSKGIKKVFDYKMTRYPQCSRNKPIIDLIT
jgi:hypothetical protein